MTHSKTEKFSHVYPNAPFCETMVDNWNKTVKQQDHIYHLSDVCIARRNLQIIKRLNGHRRLVRGNRDIFRTKEYVEAGFEEIYGVRVWPKHNVIMSHIPLHPDCLGSRKWINIHGHLHANKVTGDRAEFYQCVSVEQINYTPILAFEG